MFTTKDRSAGTTKAILSEANEISLVPKSFEETTLQSFVGYELVQGHVNAMSIQPYVEIYGVPSLKKMQAHAQQSTRLWNNTTALAINRVYHRMINYPFILGGGEIFKSLKEAVSQLADKDKRDDCITILKYYLDKIKATEKEIAALIIPLNEFRISLEEDARNLGDVLSEIKELTSLGDKVIEELKAQLSQLNQEMETLNQSIIRKKVGRDDPERSQSVGGIPVFSWIITTAKNIITKPWGPEETLLSDKEAERDRTIYQLANIERRVAYLIVLMDEYSKLQTSFFLVISAVQGMREAWGTLGFNVGNLIQELRSVEQVDIEQEKYMINIHLTLFESSVNALNKKIEAFKKARLVKIAIDDVVSKLLSPRSSQVFYRSTRSLPNELLNAYANRLQCQDQLGIGI